MKRVCQDTYQVYMFLLYNFSWFDLLDLYQKPIRIHGKPIKIDARLVGNTAYVLQRGAFPQGFFVSAK